MKRADPILWLIPLLSGGACGVAGVLTWLEMQGTGCGSGGCAAVFASVWSHWGTVPVAIPAVIIYALMFAASLLALTAGTPALRRGAWSVLVIIAIIVGGATLWFTIIQLAVLEQICPFCMADHAAGFAAALLVLTKAPIWRSSRGFGPAVRPAPLVAPASLALAVLMGGQLIIPHFFKPKLYTYQDYPDLPETPSTQPQPVVARKTSDPVTDPAPAVAASTQSSTVPTVPVVAPPAVVSDASSVASRVILAAGGRVQVNMQDWPLLGPADAKFVVVEMFDYSCPICRQLHPLLEQAIREYGGQVAIVALVVPLNSDCNPAVTTTDPHHIHACDYAHDSLAVLHADRSKWLAFDHWLFEGKEPPSPAQARAKAEELVGADAFEKALADPFVEQHIKESVGLYQKFRRGKHPQADHAKQVG